jgi:hypothetical protein
MKTQTEHERTTELFARSRAWLLMIGDPYGVTQACTSQLLTALLGVWLCDLASPPAGTSSGLRDLVALVEERLRKETDAGSFDPLRHDAKLMLLCHHILSVHHACPYSIAVFARRLAAALQGLEITPPGYAGEALLLSHLGYGDFPPVPALRAEEAGGSALKLLRADEGQIRTVCSNVAAATGYGRHRLLAEPGVQSWLVRVLPVVLLHCLREYSLETGATLLRAVRYLGLARKRAVRLATCFLMGQQQSDGKFGYFAIEAAEIGKLRDYQEFDAAGRLYLPMTVSCLWSIAETLAPGLNLFSLNNPKPSTPSHSIHPGHGLSS